VHPRPAARRADPPGLQQPGEVGADVDGVDAHRRRLGVEGGAGCPLGERECAAPLVAARLLPELLGVLVDPAQGDVEGDGVVEQRVVRQHPPLLQRGDPELAAERGAAGPQETQLGAAHPGGESVVVGGDGAFGGGDEVGEAVLQGGRAVAELVDLPAVLDGGPPQQPGESRQRALGGVHARPGAQVGGGVGADGGGRGRDVAAYVAKAGKTDRKGSVRDM
jgi:hypothetical protein